MANAATIIETKSGTADLLGNKRFVLSESMDLTSREQVVWAMAGCYSHEWIPAHMWDLYGTHWSLHFMRCSTGIMWC